MVFVAYDLVSAETNDMDPMQALLNISQQTLMACQFSKGMEPPHAAHVIYTSNDGWEAMKLKIDF